MTDTNLRVGTHNGHLMVAALQAAPGQAGDVPRRHDADRRRGRRRGSASTSRRSRRSAPARAPPAALLALNRPEVLFILGAGQTQGYRRTSLHPLGSLDDHAYVINDAGITTLIIDPVIRRARARAAREVPRAAPRC